MTGRSARLALGTTAAIAAALALAGPASAQGGRADLVISGATEAPDRQDAGTTWPQSYTVLNQGRATAGRAILRGYLSSDATQDAADARLEVTARTPRLARQRQSTGTVQLTVPAGTARGTYFVILCIDDQKQVREGNERNNCRPSGQKLGVGVSERGPIGPPGPTGPPGAAGPDAIGPNSSFRPIARTTLALGEATVDLAAFPKANGRRPDGTATPDEGSTSRTSLVKYGPFDIVATCKSVTNGNGEPPDQDPAGGGFDEDGDEAKVLVYINEGEYTMQGKHGHRKNVPGGEGTPGDDSKAGGDGKHMALAVNHDPDPAQDAADTGDEHPWSSNYRSTDAYIIHSSGTQLILRVWAGIDTLGVGNDSCIFGGVLEVVQP